MMKVDPRFANESGPEIFTGNELLLKGALEVEGGVHLLGGYPGSPVAAFFDSMSLIKDLLNERGIRATINNNEALAAAALNGSQVAGCRGMIVMKSVGVHVAADALALGALGGAHPDGGAVIVYGDDPWSDSTQVPADSRYISKHLFIPVVEPSTAQEAKDFVDLAFKLSRRSELYCGYILPTNLADGGGTVICRPNQFPGHSTKDPLDFQTRGIDLDKFVLLPPKTWWQEEKFPARMERAKAVARELGLNRIEHAPQGDRRASLGLITSGMAYDYLRQALWEMGLWGAVPICKLGMTYPLDEEMVRRMGRLCDRLVVVEERRGFIEEQAVEAVNALRARGESALPEVWGKTMPDGLDGFPTTRGLHPSGIISVLAPVLKRFWSQAGDETASARLDALDRELATIDTTAHADVGSLPARVPSFCAGCPHRDSSSLCLEIKRDFADGEYMRREHRREPMDLVFHGDIGCYTMLMFPPNTQLMHNLSGMGLGGGTGAGMDPFIRNKQVVFMGDSTFFHSGVTAISQAIKLGQDITFIILDNRTTAMTGHQTTPELGYDVLGNETRTQDIEDIVQGLGTESDDLSVVHTDPTDRRRYRQLLESTFLADGVKVIIADKECAITSTRRKRRAERAERKERGFLARQEYMNVNQDVCRFCLRCAELTGCPGLRHVETDYGPKIDTDLTSCVNDGACEQIGACSSFEKVLVTRKRKPRTRIPELGLNEIPEPRRQAPGDLWRACLVGVGGMGIGLATQILVRAGHKEGYVVQFLDKKGLAVRNGGVLSQVLFNITAQPVTPIIPYGKADLLLGVDILEAARALDPAGRGRVASPDRTAAVINTNKVQTINGIIGTEDFDPGELEEMIRRHTRADDFLARDISSICEKYLGSKLYANVMMLGFAFQKGLIPVSFHSMAWAIKDAIKAEHRKNLYAFNMGRKLCERMDIFQGPPKRTGWRETLEEKCRHTIRRHGRRGQGLADALRRLASGAIVSASNLSGELKRDLVVRIYDCHRWGGLAYAQRYTDRVLAVYAKDRGEFGYAATRAVIHQLAEAMLIKDGPFVAELSTSPEKLHRDRQKYNVNHANGDRIRYRHYWHWSWRVAGRRLDLRARLYPWQLRLLRAARFLRRVLPRWHKAERRYRDRYEAVVDAFAYASYDEYLRKVARLSSSRCLTCKQPTCAEGGCPLESNIPRWVQLAEQDRWREAADELHRTNNFPEFTAEICPAFCASACKRALAGFPVQVREIEKQIVDRAFDEGWVAPHPAPESTGKRVAIVGSGPAGLAAAQQLARAGHAVTVFDREDRVGGLLRYGIPEPRLAKRLIDRRVEQLSAEGVAFRTGVEVGRDVSASTLREGFEAILLTLGAPRPRDLSVPGRSRRGVVFAMDFLRGSGNGDGEGTYASSNDESTGPSPREARWDSIDVRGRTVTVIGGGLTGSDCVEAALRKGAREVHQLEILPASRSPGAWGLDADPTTDLDGVDRKWCVATKAFAGQGDTLTDVRAVRVKWVPSPSGPVMRELDDTEFELKTDLAVLALGFEPVPDRTLVGQLELETDEQGKLLLRDHQTSKPGVFAAGDLATGAAYVATAIDSGRKAAERINRFLR